MSYFRFFIANRKLLSFGLLLTFFSGFGQTFLFSLYVPSFIADFGLKYAHISAIYAVATLVSALCLSYLGRFIDHMDLRQFTMLVVGGFAAALLTTAIAPSAWVLALGIWGIRLTGQGLMSHTSLTAMSRYFDHARGKALSIASLGHPLSEGIFPLIIALLISSIGWRYTLGLSALSLLVFLLPVVNRSLAGQSGQAAGPPAAPTSAEASLEPVSQRQIIKNRRFWLLLPNFLAVGAIGTALFFHQLTLAAYKGWSAEWIAVCFMGFALASSSAMILAGPLVDRFSAVRLYPFYLLPFAAGILVLLVSDNRWAGMAYMVLMGLTMGAGATIRSAIQAELYGIRAIGAVRSVFTSLLIISTALGPAAYGLLLDADFSFTAILQISLGLVVVTFVLSFRVFPSFSFRKLYLSLANTRSRK
jgi:MFS family permease